MQVTAQQVSELLGHLGLKDVQIVETPDEGHSIDVDETLGAVQDNVKKMFEPEMKESIKKEMLGDVQGKVMGTARRLFARKFGVKASELDGLDSEEMIEKVLEQYDANMSKDVKQLQDELRQREESFQKERETLESEWTGKLTAEQNRVEQYHIMQYLDNVVNEIPRTGGNKSAQVKALKSDLEDKFTLKFNHETKEVELYSKENPTVPARNNNKPAVLKDAATEHFKDLGVLMTDMRTVPPTPNVASGVQPMATDNNLSPAEQARAAINAQLAGQA